MFDTIDEIFMHSDGVITCGTDWTAQFDVRTVGYIIDHVDQELNALQ